MSLFTDPGLKVNFVDGDGTAILLEPIRYEIDELRAGRAPASVPNRAAADREFALALRALGVASARVSILYAAVRGYGAVFAS